MHRVPLPYPTPPITLAYAIPPPPAGRLQRQCGRALLPILVWILAAASLCFGYYGDRRLGVGPNSSRLMQTSSVFVEQVVVRGGDPGRGVLLHGFKKRPELSLETNWTLGNHLSVDGYGRKGFDLWLNEGSRIRLAWSVDRGGKTSSEDIFIVLIKGGTNSEELQRSYYTNKARSWLADSKDGEMVDEYVVPDSDSYYIGVVNLTPRNVVATMKADITSKSYDTSSANRICSTGSSDSCKLSLVFPWTYYYVLTTTDSEGLARVWEVEVSFVARLIVYFMITGFVVIVVYYILSNLGACRSEQQAAQDPAVAAAAGGTEADPILPRKEMGISYGATEEEDAESSLCCSSQDLYDGKICVICYDEQRNCFFIPCGHSATCFTCAQRIIEGGNKVCPICRRLIHKPRRLLDP